MLPPAYVFEGLRAVLIDHQIRWDLLLQGFVLDLIIFSLAFFAFNRLLKSARRAGGAFGPFDPDIARAAFNQAASRA